VTRNRIGLFLDRDGTINAEVDFLTSPDDVVLLPTASRVIREAHELGLTVIVVTNQSGIARGLLTEKDLTAVNERLMHLLHADGAHIDALYYCPHHPTEGQAPYRTECECRKPNPGMLLRGRDAFGLDLSRSFMIGDRCADLEAGRRAGCRTGLVLTGYGMTAREECERRALADHIGETVGDVWDAFKGIIGSYETQQAT